MIQVIVAIGVSSDLLVFVGIYKSVTFSDTNTVKARPDPTRRAPERQKGRAHRDTQEGGTQTKGEVGPTPPPPTQRKKDRSTGRQERQRRKGEGET